MNDRLYLIVNADDLGYSDGINRGIVEAHQRGIVTSASLMVRQPAAEEAVFATNDCPGVSLGLHLDLGEWAFRGGEWVEVYGVVDLSDRAAVGQEIQRQLELFRALTGRKPTHLDSHQHVHRHEPVRSLLSDFAQQLQVPVRHDSPLVNYCGAFYGQTATGELLDDAISVEALIGVLRNLPAGVSELGCHPGFVDDLDTMYSRQRNIEVATLCSPTVRAALIEMRIELVSFNEPAFVVEGNAQAVFNGGAVPMEASA